jgi:peptide/nickel transport system substrate-binding protein
MSKKWSEQNESIEPNENFASSNANGTGPFKITLRELGIRTIMKKNKSWWGSVEHNIDKIELYPIADSETRVAALLSGEIDIVTDVPVQDLNRIRNSFDHKVVSIEQIRTIFLGMDQGSDELRSSNIKGRNPFKDKRVRQAFYQAIDIEAIKKNVMSDLSSPAGIITFPGVTGYTKELDKRLPYDVEASKALLAEAGYSDGFDITLNCPNDRYVNDEAICKEVISMLGKAGISVTLNSQIISKHIGVLKENISDFYMLGWGVPTLDSHYVFSFLYDSNSGWNKTNFSNERVDKLISDILIEVNLDKRNAYIAEVWSIVKDNIVYLPLHHQVISWALKKNLSVPIRSNNEPLFRFSFIK